MNRAHLLGCQGFIGKQQSTLIFVSFVPCVDSPLSASLRNWLQHGFVSVKIKYYVKRDSLLFENAVSLALVVHKDVLRDERL
jgi:hypothetical protein